MSDEIASLPETGSLGRGLRRIITERRVAYGGWCAVPSAVSAEVVSASGCDWLCIDQQHGLIGDEAMWAMVQAAAIRRTPVVVRVPWNEPAPIMRALDAGADGVIVPMVDTADQAQAAVSAAKYPPAGDRSWGPLRPRMAQPGFSPSVGNDQTVVLVMVETVQAFENLDAILQVTGVDGVQVGPFDLTISHTGDTGGAASSPRDVEMIERIAQACVERGLVAGIAAITDFNRWHDAGYTLFGLPSDAVLLGDAIRSTLATARGIE